MTSFSNKPDYRSEKPFDQMDRVELAEALAGMTIRLRACRTDLQIARENGDRETVNRLRMRVQKLAAGKAGVENCLRRLNEGRRIEEKFVRVARVRLDDDQFNAILLAASAKTFNE